MVSESRSSEKSSSSFEDDGGGVDIVAEGFVGEGMYYARIRRAIDGLVYVAYLFLEWCGRLLMSRM